MARVKRDEDGKITKLSIQLKAEHSCADKENCAKAIPVGMEKGSAVEVRCELLDEEGLETETFDMELPNNTLKKADPSTSKTLISHNIDNFAAEDQGLYTCTAELTNGKKRLRPKLQVTENFLRCEINTCQNGGQCVISSSDGAPYCECPSGFGGENCDHVLVVSPLWDDCQTMKTYGIPTVSFVNVAMASLIVVFAFLWWRERKARRTYGAFAGSCLQTVETSGMCTRDTFVDMEAKFANAFPNGDGKSKNGIYSESFPACPIAEPEHASIHSTSTEEQRKLRVNYRDRLPGTSDSRLLDSPPAAS